MFNFPKWSIDLIIAAIKTGHLFSKCLIDFGFSLSSMDNHYKFSIVVHYHIDLQDRGLKWVLSSGGSRRLPSTFFQLLLDS